MLEKPQSVWENCVKCMNENCRTANKWTWMWLFGQSIQMTDNVCHESKHFIVIAKIIKMWYIKFTVLVNNGKYWRWMGMKSSQISQKVWAVYKAWHVLLTNSDRNSHLTVLLMVDWVSCWLWDHPIVNDDCTVNGICVVFTAIQPLNLCVSSQCVVYFFNHLLLSLSSPLPLTLTVRSIHLNDQLNASILAKMAWRRIT